MPIFTDFLQLQPGESQQTIRSVNSTLGVKALISNGNKALALYSKWLENG